MKVLHVIGGDLRYGGASKGACILHNALIKLGVHSSILNDTPPKNNQNLKNVSYINNSFFYKLMNKAFVSAEKMLKTLFLHSPRETFTIGFFGFDITKLKEYKEADIIHLHWLNQGFVRIGSLSKIEKPVVWTLRDMWVFTGGSHYSMDFEKYEKSKLSKIMRKFKKNNYGKKFNFITISNWLKNEAEKSEVLNNFKIRTFYNNIDLESFKHLSKEKAKNSLKITTKKKILLYGASNPQSKRKGWEIFINTLKMLDKSKYYLLIFGNFWSNKILDEIGIEYKSLGFVYDKETLNSVYSSADVFIASSIQDGWPKTFAEAMYCNTPVICFSKTSIAEIVDHKINGYVVENFNSEKLKDGIDWLVENIENKNLKFENTKNKIINYGSEKIAKKYIELYKDILKKN